MRCSSRDLAVITLALISAACSGQVYEIARIGTNGGLYGLNNHGDYVVSLGAGNQMLHLNGVDVQVPTSNIPGYPLGGFLTGVSDNRIGFGRVATSSTGYRAAVWTADGGWVVMPFGPFRSEARGVTASMRVLCSGSSGTGDSLLPGWWQIGENPVSIQLSSTSWSVNQRGDALFSAFAGSYVMPAGAAPTELLVDGVSPTLVSGLNEFALSCGLVQLASGSFGIVWNSDATVRTRVQLGTEGGFTDLNSSEVVVGRLAFGDPDGAILYSSATGVRRISTLLTPQFSGWRFVSASEINNRGQILAIGYAPGSTSARSVLLNPVPEPASMTVMGAGIAAFLRRRQSKSGGKTK